MEFVTAGWCQRKWLRLYQTIKNLTFSNMENPVFGDLTGSKQIEKDQVRVSSRPV